MTIYKILRLQDFDAEYYNSLSKLCSENRLNEGSIRNKLTKASNLNKNFVIFKEYKIEKITVKK